jgi:hypothetical protein
LYSHPWDANISHWIFTVLLLQHMLRRIGITLCGIRAVVVVKPAPQPQPMRIALSVRLLDTRGPHH